QHILDEWLAGDITDEELRERIRFDAEWGYDWNPYLDLLRRARAAGARLHGLDCMPRGDLRRIGARDRHAATKISELRAEFPDARIIVLFGESHLAPEHLPAALHSLLPSEKAVTVLQNVDALYWRASGEPHGNVAAVRVSERMLCVFNATPLEKYESYRMCIDRWTRMPSERPDFASSIYNLVGALARALNINPYSPQNGTQPRFLVDQLPEVYRRPSLESALRLLDRKGVAAEEVAAAEDAMASGGMAYIASLNVILTTGWELSGAAEPVARFVHAACRRPACSTLLSADLSPDDRFYSRVMEIAIADFGARVLYPARPAVRESDLYSLYAAPREAIEEKSILSYRDYMRMIDFLVFHRDYERNLRKYWETPPLILEGRNYTGERFEFVARQLGQMLGTELYDAYISGAVPRRFVRSLLFRKLEKPEVARVGYFSIVRRTRRPGRRQPQAAF
ncbi:MAG: ChaN family lipoprotein, partial [Acidobacteria bacterium]|nr:ChaN family lipoprotein [Acidobacteriota bacterium]